MQQRTLLSNQCIHHCLCVTPLLNPMYSALFPFLACPKVTPCYSPKKTSFKSLGWPPAPSTSRQELALPPPTQQVERGGHKPLPQGKAAGGPSGSSPMTVTRHVWSTVSYPQHSFSIHTSRTHTIFQEINKYLQYHCSIDPCIIHIFCPLNLVHLSPI